ncbi:hypothetical protein [Mycolicibacterium goodii]|uniref:hypothetical protein n=1 Tax=Mycolicibacterium goodii TaxID=134601 RepID=UPI001BDDB7E9|nr:hypothetical protein [Mycolicibacterium goodii]MBU8834475.1 hypothetical protein [Mycolicibacterium goodii]
MRFSGKPGNHPAGSLHAQIAEQHLEHYLATLRGKLADAREDWLQPTWRTDLVNKTTRSAPPRLQQPPRKFPVLARPPSQSFILAIEHDPYNGDVARVRVAGPVVEFCLMQLGELELRAELDAAAEIGVDLVKVCAELDVAHLPAAQWEPYRAEGNWRAALDAWLADAVSVLDGYRSLTPCPERDIPDRDILEVSYRLGIEAGCGRDTGWRDWLADRLPHWPDKHLADQYRLTLLNPGAGPRTESGFSMIGADRESNHRTAIDLMRLFGYTGPAPLPTLPWCRLPDYWTNASPEEGPPMW